LAIKEMPLEEKHDKLYDIYLSEMAASYAFHKKQGTVNKWLDSTLEVFSSSMPKFMGPIVKLMRTLAPGRTFKQTANQMVYMQQIMQPSSEIEVSWVSDREAVMRFKNCEILRRSRETVKKAGLKIDPRFYCKIDQYRHTSPLHPMQKFGIDLACELEENGCKWTFKLK